MKALLIIGLFIINDACADFTIEAKCFKDERTGILLTYDEDRKPIVVETCKNPENTQLFYWRIRQAIRLKKGETWISKCFVSRDSPIESVNTPSITCGQLRSVSITDLYNSN